MKIKMNSSNRVSESIRFAAACAPRRWLAASLCLAALWPEAVHGLGVRIPNQDAEAIARGNAFAATADNPSAIYYNPAGITQLPGFDIQVGLLNYFGINTTYTSPGGAQTDSLYHNVPVPQFFATYSPENLPLSFGLGVYSPFGLSVEWPDTPDNFRSLAISAKLEYISINPIVAWKIDKTLSLAVGPDINYSKIDIKRGLASPIDVFQFTGQGVSYGLNAGIRWQPLEQWSFGVNYRLPSDMNYSGSSTYGPNFMGLPPASTHTTAQFQFPQIISGGVSYRPTPDWNIEADIDWADWHTLRTVTLNGTANNPYLGINLPLVLNWQSSYFYEIGATRYFKHGWFVSAGYFYSTQTTSAQDYTPAVPDTGLHVGSLGFGHKGEHWNWALAGQIITGPARTIGNSQADPFTGQTANGSYQLFVPTLTVSAGYHF
jgi:long-chain fatty acid transport protein